MLVNYQLHFASVYTSIHVHACERTHKSSIGNDLIIVEMTSDIKFATFERRVK